MTEDTYFNPFPGLRAFEEDEDYLFFGRDKQIRELLSKLESTHFLAVVGSSGSGKSSLVKSGLLPSLHKGLIKGIGSGWRIGVSRPGEDPIGNLARCLASKEFRTDNEIDQSSHEAMVETTLRRSDEGLNNVVDQFLNNTKENILIVIDQFEELFRFSRFEKSENSEQRDSLNFIKLLLGARSLKNSRIYVVFTMRSDFLSDCTQFRGLPEAINDGQYLIPRMTREEIRKAITGPVSMGGAEISPVLVTKLLNDIGDNPDQLPILQHAMMRTWDHWSKINDEIPIELGDYLSVGGMDNALSLHADEAFNELNEKQQLICAKLFEGLTEKNNSGRGVRRPTMVSELCELSDADISDVKRIVEVFRQADRSFLMPPVGTEITENTVIDISHESLMRVWKTLVNWVKEEIESAELFLKLAHAAEGQQIGKVSPWRDPELELSVQWEARKKPNKTWADRYDASFERTINFLDYSVKEKEKLQPIE